MVDCAVTRFGRWAEARLSETHKVGKEYQPRWKPEQIFTEPTEVSIVATATGGDEWTAWLEAQGGKF